MKYPKLDPEFKKKWVEALRSGKYRQATGQLYDHHGGDIPAMCCLGVAEHILGTSLEDMDSEMYFPKDLANPLSPEILWGTNDTKDGTDVACTLAYMNDGNTAKKIKKHTFEEIADWIEQNL